MRLASHVLFATATVAASPVMAAETIPDVRIEVTSRIDAYDGRTFGNAGPYERIAGIAHLRIDPRAAANRGIVDLAKAPRDSDGLVAYDVDVVILRPKDGTRARRVMLYDVVNRGMKLMAMFTGGSAMGGGDPIAPGDGLLLRQGYTLVWSGWQGDITLSGNGKGLIGARFPVASDGDKPLTGPVSTETIFDNTSSNRLSLPYRAATLDQASAKLTVRAVTGAPAREIAASDWRFEDDRHVTLTRPAAMDAGAIYRFDYVARDPVVMGLGFTATRDLIAFLRHGSAAQGNPLADLSAAPCEKDAKQACVNPRGGAFSAAIAFGGSQSGRYLRDFLWQGFNSDLAGRRVFDGVIPFIPGARQTYTNYRFAEPGRFSRQHEDHDVPGFGFPFTYATLTDPVTGRRDGILATCSADGTCPRVFHIDTSGEFWQAGASLVGTGGTNRDVALPANVRAYMIAGGAHAPGMALPACRYPANPLNYTPIVRALLIGMVDWTLGRAEPPASRWPSLGKGELRPVDALRGPEGIVWPKVFNQPISPAGKRAWPQYLPAIDTQGNDQPGIRMPEVAVAEGTYLGWNLRKPGFGEGDLCLIAGSYLPFPADRREPPATVAERRAAVVGELAAERLLLAEDAARLRATLVGSK